MVGSGSASYNYLYAMAIDKCSRYRVDVNEDQVKAAKYGAQSGLTGFTQFFFVFKMSTEAIGGLPDNYGKAEGLDMLCPDLI